MGKLTHRLVDFNKFPDIQTPHSEYLSLGKRKEERVENYRALFKAHMNAELLKEIRESVNKGLALGSERFTAQIEALTKRRLHQERQGAQKRL